MKFCFVFVFFVFVFFLFILTIVNQFLKLECLSPLLLFNLVPPVYDSKENITNTIQMNHDQVYTKHITRDIKLETSTPLQILPFIFQTSGLAYHEAISYSTLYISDLPSLPPKTPGLTYLLNLDISSFFTRLFSSVFSVN
jgi:hypothetical protein